MKIFCGLFLCLFGLVFSVNSQTPPKFKQIGNDVTSMSRMLGEADGMKCRVMASKTGVIVKRDFDSDEVTITGFIVKLANDKRLVLNLDESRIGLLGHFRNNLIDSLLSQSRKVKINYSQCTGGGSGLFNYVSSVMKVAK